MITLTDVQFIKNQAGIPEYAVMPFNIFQALASGNVKAKIEELTIPHEVIKIIAHNGVTPIQAWREYLNLTQTEVAEKMGISQAAYSQMEAAKKPRKITLQKIAEAMNIDYLQLKI